MPTLALPTTFARPLRAMAWPGAAHSSRLVAPSSRSRVGVRSWVAVMPGMLAGGRDPAVNGG
jgi:hypothetical protein